MGAESPRFRTRIRTSTWRQIAYLAFWLVAIALALRWSDRAIPRYLPKDWSQAHEFDGLQDWLAARLYLTGGNPFSAAGLAQLRVTSFGHPPTTAFWFTPLARFDKATAAELIGLLTWFLLALQLYICAKAFKFPAPIALAILLFAWALTTEGLVMHWHAVQISEEIAFPLVVCWVYLRRGKQVPAGLALGFAATLKLFPGVLMLFLLFARRYRAFVVASMLFAAVAGVMTKAYGIDCWQLFFTQQGPVSREWMGSVRNASLQGIVVRLFSPACVGPSLPSAKSSYIATALSIALLIAGGFLSRKNLRAARERDSERIDQPFALFTVLAVFVNPWVWEHYWVFLIQPGFVVANSFWQLFRVTLRAWLDERASTQRLAAASSVSLLAAIGLGAVVELLGTQDIRTERLSDLWFATRSPWAHRQFHLHEVMNWLPWVVMILLCSLCALVPRWLESVSSQVNGKAVTRSDQALVS